MYSVYVFTLKAIIIIWKTVRTYTVPVSFLSNRCAMVTAKGSGRRWRRYANSRISTQLLLITWMKLWTYSRIHRYAIRTQTHARTYPNQFSDMVFGGLSSSSSSAIVDDGFWGYNLAIYHFTMPATCALLCSIYEYGHAQLANPSSSSSSSIYRSFLAMWCRLCAVGSIVAPFSADKRQYGSPHTHTQRWISQKVTLKSKPVLANVSSTNWKTKEATGLSSMLPFLQS